MTKQRNAGAIVRLTIELTTGTWGPECTLDQITKQAKDEAVNRVRRAVQAINAEHVMKLRSIDGVRVVLTEEEEP